MPSSPSQVTAVYVHAGEQVASGTLLLKLDNADAVAKVQSALSSVATANAAVHDIRCRRLAGRNQCSAR